MSFLSGLASFGKAAFGVVTDDGFLGSAIRTVGLGLILSKLSSNAIKSNRSGTRNIDQGVRLQIRPDSQAKIPVLYGQAYFGGNIFDARMSDDNKTMWYALALSEKSGGSLSASAGGYVFNDVYRNNQRIVFQSDGITSAYSVDTNGTIDNSIAGLFQIYLYAGDSTAGQTPQGYSSVVPDAYSLFPEWTQETHPATDLIFAIIRVRYSRDKNVTELGDILFQVTNKMHTPGDVVYDYLSNNRYGLGIDDSSIDTASLLALNTYSNSDVAYNDEGTGAQTLPSRYQINGLVDTDENSLSNVENICSAAASWLSYDTQAGVWSVIINKDGFSRASFNDTNVLGNVSVGSTGLTDLYNSVKVEFPHRELRDSGDFIKIEIPEDQRNPNEPDNTLVITYDIINEPVQAELLGFIELKQSRVDLVVEFQVDYSYLGLKAGDIVTLTNARLAFSFKKFRIISVSESQSDDGISLSINALEYDADVYSVQDITRFTRSNADGIITIGQIGTPSQPQITKFESNSRPRVQLESISPIGVVEALEFWISNDVNTTESSRSYTLLTTQRPTGNETYVPGTNVTTQVDSISSSEFVIKSRGINNVLTGPYSEPSVTVVFVPQQTTDAIGPNTALTDNTGALATALGVLTLLSSLDSLFAGANDGAGLFDVIFDTFKDVTGVDLVGDASEGTLVVSAELATLVNGTIVTNNSNSFDFVGSGFELSTDEDNNVVIDFSNFAALPVGVNNKDIVAWNAEASEWQVISDCITCDFPPPPDPDPEPGEAGGDPIVCSIGIGALLPLSTPNKAIKNCDPSGVPTTGPYFIEFGAIDGGIIDGELQPDIPYYSQLILGPGSISLYTADDVLQQSILATSCTVYNNVLSIPFGTRRSGSTYYILVDQGIVSNCDCESVAIAGKNTWTFTTNPTPVDEYTVPAKISLSVPNFTSPTYSRLTATMTPDFTTTALAGQNIVMTFSEPVAKGTGTIQIFNVATDTVVKTLAVAGATIASNVATLGNSSGLPEGGNYRVEVPAGAFVTDRQPQDETICDVINTYYPNQSLSLAINTAVNTPPPLGDAPLIEQCEICSRPWGNNVLDKVSVLSDVQLNFLEPVFIQTDAPAILNIHSRKGYIHETFDMRDLGYSGGTKTIKVTPTNMLDPNTDYFITTESGALKDQYDRNTTIADTGLSSFRTVGLVAGEGGPASPPPRKFRPDGGQTLSFEIDRPAITKGAGKLNIIDSNGSLVGQVDSDNPAIKYSDTV